MLRILFLLLIAIPYVPARAQSFLLTEDFESGMLPAGWTNISNATDGGWKFGTNAQLQSQYFLIPEHTKMAATNDQACNCDKNDEYLATPPLDFSQASVVYLSFDAYFREGGYQSVKEKARVKVSINGGNTWTTVLHLTGNSNWVTYHVNLSAYAGLTNVMVAFNYSDKGGWIYGLALDNVQIYEPAPGNDLEVSSVLAGRYDARPQFIPFEKHLVGTPLVVQTLLTNKGTTPITSFDISWSDGYTTHSQNISGINLAPLQTYLLEFSMPYHTLQGLNTVTVLAENINNGAGETVLTNNSKYSFITGLAPHPDKKYLAEKSTGTWCAWCPRGIVFMDYMMEAFPEQFIGISVHGHQFTSDPMVNADYNSAIASLPDFMGYPSMLINRSHFLDPLYVELDFIEQVSQELLVVVTTDAVYDPGTHSLLITVGATFSKDLSGDFRFNAIAVEDSVHENDPDYSQANAYSYGTWGPMGGFENLPSWVSAADMFYSMVGRDLISGSFNGSVNSLPYNIKAGETYYYTYSYAIPPTINLDQLYVVGLVSQTLSNTSVVLNASKTKWHWGTGQMPAASSEAFTLYPNPATSSITLQYWLSGLTEAVYEIRNQFGQIVQHGPLGLRDGLQREALELQDLNAGIYFVHLITGKQRISRKLVVQQP